MATSRPSLSTHPPCVRCVDAEGADAAQEELERLAKCAGPVAVAGKSLRHADLDLAPHGPELGVAPRGLDPADDTDHRADEVLAIVPAVDVEADLALDEGKVDGLVDGARLAAPCDLGDAVADLAQHAEHAHEARGGEAEVVGQAVPEGLCGVDMYVLVEGES